MSCVVDLSFCSLNIHKITIMIAPITWNKKRRIIRNKLNTHSFLYLSWCVCLILFCFFLLQFLCTFMFSELVCAFEEYVQFLRCSSLHIIFMNWTWILSKRQPPQKQLKQTKTKGERRKKKHEKLLSLLRQTRILHHTSVIHYTLPWA